MPNKPSFQQTQYQFAAHIRNPDANPIPEGIEERRMTIYRDLFYNNIAGFIESGFPVIHSILSEEEWHVTIREFMVHHQASSPYFAEVAKEFVSFVEGLTTGLVVTYPFIKELAHYEWVELALMIDPNDVSQIAIKDSVDLLGEQVVVSPLAWPLAYEYDVHHISRDYQPTEPPQTPSFLIVYRNRKDDVEFTEINAVTFTLVQLLIEHKALTGEGVLNILAEQMPQVPQQAIFDNGLDIIMKLMKRDVVLGVKR